MEVVGEFLGFHQDTQLYRYFRTHYRHFFPALGRVCRTTLVRQVANLWRVKELVWQHLLRAVPHHPHLAIVDSFPLPVCRFARAKRCQLFKGEAAFGWDHVARQTFYGFRIHALVSWPGVITCFSVAPANIHDLDLVPELTQGLQGVLLGDRNYWSPTLTDSLADQGLTLLAPFKNKKADPTPKVSYQLSGPRYRIETVFSQLVERFQIRQLQVKDLWHLMSRRLRKALSHTLAFTINQQQGNPPLQFAKLLNT